MFASQRLEAVPASDLPATLPLAGLYVYSNPGASCASSKTLAQRHADFLVRQGCEQVADPHKANILLVDTCAFSASAENASLDLIREARHKARPGARVVVTGCLAAINPGKIESEFSEPILSARTEEQLAALFSLKSDVQMAPALAAGFNPRRLSMNLLKLNRWHLPEVPRVMTLGAWFCLVFFALDRHVPLRRIPALRYFFTLASEADPRNYVITISEGCVGNCTFCAIPLAKGRTRSAPLGAILDEVRRALSLGAREITLASEDTGAYGTDIGTSIVDLLDRLNSMAGDFRLNIDFFDPRWLRRYGQSLIDVLSAGRVGKVQIPVQSGSDTVLGRMARAYKMEHVLPAIYQLRRQAPEVLVTTQLIAGFPGETEEEHVASRRLVESEVFHYAHVFPFSSRPNTRTIEMTDHLPTETVMARASELNLIVQRQLLKRAIGAARQPVFDRVLAAD